MDLHMFLGDAFSFTLSNTFLMVDNNRMVAKLKFQYMFNSLDVQKWKKKKRKNGEKGRENFSDCMLFRKFLFSNTIYIECTFSVQWRGAAMAVNRHSFFMMWVQNFWSGWTVSLLPSPVIFTFFLVAVVYFHWMGTWFGNSVHLDM